MLVDKNASLQKFEILKKSNKFIARKLLIPNEVYDNFLRVVNKRVDLKTFRKYSILARESIREFGISFGHLPISLHKFEENKDGLLVFLEEARSQIVFDNSKSLDLQNMFDKYFASNEKIFENCTIESINQNESILLTSLNYKV